MAKKIDAKISLKTDGTGKVVADVNKVTDSVRNSTRSVSSLKKQLSSINMAAKITAVAGAMSIVSGVVGGIKNAVGAVVGAVDGFAAKADTIAKFSRNVGLSSEQLQKWRYAAERSGMSTENFDNSLRKFSVNVSKAANGEKKQLDVFNALGVSLRKQNGEMKSNNELMLEVADAYKKVTNAQDKLRISEELFGKGGMGFGTMFADGASGVQALLDRRAKIGGLVSDEDAKKAEEFKDILLDVDKVKEAIENRAMSKLMPSLSQGFDEFLNWWDVNGESVLDNVKIAVDVVVYSVRDLIEWFVQAIEVFKNWGDVWNGLKITFGEFASDIWSGFYETFIKPFADFFGSIPGIVSKISEFVGGVFGGIRDAVSGVFTGIKNSILESIAAVAEKLSALPLVGDKFAGVAQEMRSGIAAPQKQNPSGVHAAQSYTETRNTTNTSRLSVDFSGMPKGTSVTPSSGFNFGAIDYTTGYTFGY